MTSNDLVVQSISDALRGTTIDLVVSGSIGAVESVKLIRSLRRLGADIHPWLTQGGALFVTGTALSWAAARPCKQQFEGEASHIAQHDACVIAPASASLIAKVAHGITDSPATALISSYLGQNKPVLLLASMHDSLKYSPFIAENLQSLSKVCTILKAHQEEGKQKFPDPTTLADDISHRLRTKPGAPKILLTMGTTRAYIDSIRYISNYSSGSLGTQIAHEFHRQGFAIKVIAGPSSIRPRSFDELVQVETNAEMSAAVDNLAGQGLSAAIFAASVLDFVPDRQLPGKIRSDANLVVNFIKTPKIIAQVTQPLAMKVGFKLETEDQSAAAQKLARDYLQRYRLSHLIMNFKKDVSESRHRAFAYVGTDELALELTDKAAIACYLAQEARRLLGCSAPA